jgi:hypothetical protein
MSSKVSEAAGTVERLLLPRLNSIDGELKSMNTRIDLVQGEVSKVRRELHGEIGSVRNEMGSVRHEMGSLRNEVTAMHRETLANIAKVEQKVDSLAVRFDLIKDVEKLKVKVAELEKRR